MNDMTSNIGHAVNTLIENGLNYHQSQDIIYALSDIAPSDYQRLLTFLEIKKLGGEMELCDCDECLFDDDEDICDDCREQMEFEAEYDACPDCQEVRAEAVAETTPSTPNKRPSNGKGKQTGKGKRPATAKSTGRIEVQQ
jgi:hypothetical protein